MTQAMVNRSALRKELEGASDNALVALAREGEEAAIRSIIKRHNQRLFRVARAIVGDDAEAEDVVQASYISAFTHLGDFREEAQLSTWLSRIAANEAISRLRRRRPTTELEQVDIEGATSAQIIQFPMLQPQANPESEMGRQEVREFLEQAVDHLPPHFRAVFVLRDVEGLSVEETASYLSIKARDGPHPVAPGAQADAGRHRGAAERRLSAALPLRRRALRAHGRPGGRRAAAQGGIGAFRSLRASAPAPSRCCRR